MLDNIHPSFWSFKAIILIKEFKRLSKLYNKNMKLNFSQFADVLSFKISWFEANPLWVVICLLIYATLIVLFVNAIRMSIKFEKIHEQEREKTYGQFPKEILIVGFTTTLIILSYSIIQKL